MLLAQFAKLRELAVRPLAWLGLGLGLGLGYGRG